MRNEKVTRRAQVNGGCGCAGMDANNGKHLKKRNQLK
jgi:hypothetical protein